MADESATDRDTIEQLADSFVTRFRAGRAAEHRGVRRASTRSWPTSCASCCRRWCCWSRTRRRTTRRAFGGATTPSTAPREIGDFTIVREIGRGGMGVVYEAVQQSLGRHVALKVLSSPGLLNPSHLERFRLEARSAGRLHHSHIVPVFGVGEHDGLHYYAMQFIAGQSLDQVIDALRKLRPGHGADKTAPPAQTNSPTSLAGAVAERTVAR